MKSIVYFSFIILTLLPGCRSRSVDQLQSELDGISKRWVPDKRVGICQFKILNGKGNTLILQGESLFPEAKSEALQLLSSKGVAFTDSVVVLPDTTQQIKPWGVITLSVANMRSRPSHPSEMVSQAIMGTPVRVLKEEDGWVLIQTPDKYIAWTNGSAVQQMTLSSINNWRNTIRIIFTGSTGVVFEDRKQTTVLSDIVAGAIIVKKSEDQNGFEVNLPDERTGFVSRPNWLNFNQWKDTVALHSNQMIHTGKQFLGFPYLWGGTSSKGIDCSGFTKTVCFLNGMILERDASQQVNHGKKIDVSAGWENLQKGDLLFFGSKQPFRVVHVGMYIGEGDFINSSGRVRINSFDKSKEYFSDHLTKTLVEARRMIGFTPEKGFLPIKMHNWY